MLYSFAIIIMNHPYGSAIYTWRLLKGMERLLIES